MTLRRFYGLEKHFEKNLQLKENYRAVIQEYEKLLIKSLIRSHKFALTAEIEKNVSTGTRASRRCSVSKNFVS